MFRRKKYSRAEREKYELRAYEFSNNLDKSLILLFGGTTTIIIAIFQGAGFSSSLTLALFSGCCGFLILSIISVLCGMNLSILSHSDWLDYMDQDDNGKIQQRDQLLDKINERNTVIDRIRVWSIILYSIGMILISLTIILGAIK